MLNRTALGAAASCRKPWCKVGLKSSTPIKKASSHLLIISKNGTDEILKSVWTGGRALDNVFVERLWRTVKYENVYLKCYEGMKQLKPGRNEYFEFYNHKRPHSSLDGSTPAGVYCTAGKDEGGLTGTGSVPMGALGSTKTTTAITN